MVEAPVAGTIAWRGFLDRAFVAPVGVCIKFTAADRMCGISRDHRLGYVSPWGTCIYSTPVTRPWK